MFPLSNEAEYSVTCLLLTVMLLLKICVLFIFSIDIGILLYKYLKNHSIRTLFQDRTAEIVSHINIVPVLRHPYLSLIYRGYWWVTFMTRKLQSWCAICNHTAFFNPSCCLLKKKNPALLSPCLLLFQFSSSSGLLSVLSKSSGAVRKSSLDPRHLFPCLITSSSFTWSFDCSWID